MTIITHKDFDGIMSAILVSEMENVKDIIFSSPFEITESGMIGTKKDIVCDLPYLKGIGMWFDHHASNKKTIEVKGSFKIEKSCARVIFDYYKSPELDKYKHLVDVTDKLDTADFNKDDLLNPQDFVLLFQTTELSLGKDEDNEYYLNLIEYLKTKSIDEILNLPDVKERIEVIQENIQVLSKLIPEWASIEENYVIIDVRGKGKLPKIIKFLTSALYPEMSYVVCIFDGKKYPDSSHVNMGYNVLQKDMNSNLDMGQLASTIGKTGGGHKCVAGCDFPNELFDENIKKLKAVFKEYG